MSTATFASRKQERQCSYGLTMRRVSATIVSGKAMNITQLECVFVALVIQHAMCMCHIVSCDLPRSKIFFHVIS
jgi:hypothetical protein